MFCENSTRLSIKSIPRERFAIRLFHVNDHRDPDGSIRRSYAGKSARRCPNLTVAEVIDRETGEPVVWATSRCSKRDVPHRRVGSGIALGRLVKAFREYMGEGESTPKTPSETALNALGDEIVEHPLPTLRVVR